MCNQWSKYLEENEFYSFIREGVPFIGNEIYDRWVAEAKSICKNKIADLEDILRNGPEPMHYCAMICLRQFGYDNGQLGDGDAVKYYIYKNGKTEHFVPKDKPIQYDSMEDWLENGYGSLYTKSEDGELIETRIDPWEKYR